MGKNEQGEQGKRRNLKGIIMGVGGVLSAIAAVIAIYHEKASFVAFWKWNQKNLWYEIMIALLCAIIALQILFRKTEKKGDGCGRHIAGMSKLSGQLTECGLNCGDNVGNMEKLVGTMKELCGKFEEQGEACKSNVDSLKTFMLDNMSNGILGIKPRTEYDNNYYKTMYSRANEKLTISGHSLNDTIDKKRSRDLRQDFKNSIIRVLKHGGDVKILIQEVNPDKEDSEKKRQNFYLFISDLCNEIKDKGKAEGWGNLDQIALHFLVKEIKLLRYFVVRTENATLISYYKMDRHADNKDIYVFQVDPERNFGKCYLDDFEKVFDREAEFIKQVDDMIHSIGGDAK